jgi:hypothetical protein
MQLKSQLVRARKRQGGGRFKHSFTCEENSLHSKKKNKGKENVLDPVEEVRGHVDFHSSNEESSEEINSLIIPFEGKGWQEGHETQCGTGQSLYSIGGKGGGKCA